MAPPSPTVRGMTGRPESPSPRLTPLSRISTIQSINTAVQSVTITPASARSVSSAAPSPYMSSIQSSPATFREMDVAHLATPGPFELPESIVAAEQIFRNPSAKENAGAANKAGGLMRKLSQSAKAGVQNTGHKLRRKASSTIQVKEQSTGPITRRRSDSKNASSNTVSTTDASPYEQYYSHGPESSVIVKIGDIANESREPVSPVQALPEGTAPILPEKLIHGSMLTKVTKRKKKKVKFFLSLAGSRVTWMATISPKSFCIDDIRSIRVGSDAANYRQEFKCADEDADRWFTILYLDDRSKQTKAVHLIAPTKEDMKLWLDTLDALSKHREDLMMGLTGSAEREHVIRAHWDREVARRVSRTPNTPGQETLELPEIETLCRSLHIHCSKAMISDHFRHADESNSGRLTYIEFKSFIRRLKERKDLLPLYQAACDSALGLSREQFLLFLQRSQNIDVSSNLTVWEEEFARLAGSTGPRDEMTSDDIPQQYLGFDAFASFLVSKYCNVYQSNPPKVKFDHPLNEYFISSSHNTYLCGRQVAGESSTEAYITALRHGCRCVEIDCWDGQDGLPIVTHGYTKTTAVLFSDCISVIGRYAFESSPYPVMLSLEVHCDAIQQLRMVHIMKEILKEKLVLEPLQNGSTGLPSPEELKHRILVKVKASDDSFEHEPSFDMLSTGRHRSRSSPGVPPVSAAMPSLSSIPPLPSLQTASPPSSHTDTPSSPQERSTTATSTSSDGDDSDGAKDLTATKTPTKKPKPSKITKPLADLGIYLQGYKYPGFMPTEGLPANHIFSLDETKARNICKNPAEKMQFEDYNTKYLSRVYPRRNRINSSNFDPNDFWRRGVQMAALNWQTYDQNMQMNQAMFAAGSDRHGFVLKPEYLRRPGRANKNFVPPPKLPKLLVKVSMEIVSAQQLPRLHSMSRTVGINPFIVVQMFSADDKTRGTATGTGGEESSTRNGYYGVGSPYSRRTKVVADNGYNPQFNAVFELELETKYPELVFVRWIVYNSRDGKTTNNCPQLAVFTAKLSSLQQGYRHLPLFNGHGEEFIFSTLFCRIRKSNPRLLAQSLQDTGDRTGGRNLMRSILSRNHSTERSRDRAVSLDEQQRERQKYVIREIKDLAALH